MIYSTVPEIKFIRLIRNYQRAFKNISFGRVEKARKDAKLRTSQRKPTDPSKPSEEGVVETEEQLEEIKRKKEAKESQVEEFYREKFLFKERQLMKEISKWSSVLNEVPIGRDRTFKRYFQLSAIDGIVVENEDDGAELLLDLNRHEREEFDFESDNEIAVSLFASSVSFLYTLCCIYVIFLCDTYNFQMEILG